MAAETPTDPDDERAARLFDRLDLLLAVLLGVAAIVTAVAAYNAALKDGDTVKAYSEGIRATNDANGLFNESVQQITRDEGVFLEFAKSTQEGDEDLAQYVYEALMDKNLRRAVDEWEASDDLPSPLDARSYRLESLQTGERLQQVTDERFERAQAFDEAGDGYDLVGVIGAVALFFLGIAGVVRSLRTKLATTAIGGLVLLVAMVGLLAV